MCLRERGQRGETEEDAGRPRIWRIHAAAGGQCTAANELALFRKHANLLLFSRANAANGGGSGSGTNAKLELCAGLFCKKLQTLQKQVMHRSPSLVEGIIVGI